MFLSPVPVQTLTVQNRRVECLSLFSAWAAIPLLMKSIGFLLIDNLTIRDKSWSSDVFAPKDGSVQRRELACNDCYPMTHPSGPACPANRRRSFCRWYSIHAGLRHRAMRLSRRIRRAALRLHPAPRKHVALYVP